MSRRSKAELTAEVEALKAALVVSDRLLAWEDFTPMLPTTALVSQSAFPATTTRTSWP